MLKFNVDFDTILNKFEKVRKDFNRGDYIEMNRELSLCNWDELFRMYKHDVNKQWEIFKNILNDVEEKYEPKKTIISNSQRKGKFPISAKTRKLIRRKDRLWTRYIETRDGQKKVRALTRKLRKEFEKHVASQLVSNNKLLW